MDLINIASGYLPLSLEDVDRGIFTKVINFDPLDDSSSTERYMHIVHVMKNIDRDLRVYSKWSDVDEKCDDANTRLVLSISPYGFSAIDAKVDRKVAPGGWVLLMGAMANPWVTYNRAFDGAVRHHYTEARARIWPNWLNTLMYRLLLRYPSQTSNLERSTKLQQARIFQKS